MCEAMVFKPFLYFVCEHSIALYCLNNLIVKSKNTYFITLSLFKLFLYI